jgi:hypothetical protein
VSDYEEQEKRIANIFGSKDVPIVNRKTLRIFHDYLKKNLESPCLLTGIEDFPWEERFVFGFGNKDEYERLKETHPSYTDSFELLNIDQVDPDRGILAVVQRISDNKVFSLPLADLEARGRDSKNYQLLDDYSVWFVNYG